MADPVLRFDPPPLRDEKGIGLVISLLVLAIVSALGATVIAGNMADLQISTNYTNRSVAFYAADSGVESALRDLRSDSTWILTYLDPQTWEPLSPLPEGVSINGAAVTSVTPGDVSAGYWTFGGRTALGDGAYSRQILLPPQADVDDGEGTITFTIRSTGEGGRIEAGQQVVRGNVELDVDAHGVWDNAIFAGEGQAGNLINGNVAIRGSVHVLGDESAPETIEFSGTADIRNNYADAVDHFGATDAAKLPALDAMEVNGEWVESLEAVVRLAHANIELGGSADIGAPDTTGNGVKETMDAIRSDGTITPPEQVHADEWGGYDAHGVEFPTLDDPYVAADGSTWSSHRDFLEARSLLIPQSEISPDVADFSYSDAWGNSITWDQDDGELTITGIVRVAQDLRLGKQHGNPGRRGFEYRGTGTLYAPGEMEIDGPVVPAGNYLADGNLGLIAGDDVRIDYTAQINVFAAIYAQNEVRVAKQTNIAGALVSRTFDLGANVPSVFQVPDLAGDLPPGMPGSGRLAVIKAARVVDWYQER